MVECGGLENRFTRNPGNEGSNPSSSARNYQALHWVFPVEAPVFYSTSSVRIPLIRETKKAGPFPDPLGFSGGEMGIPAPLRSARPLPRRLGRANSWKPSTGRFPDGIPPHRFESP